ncbi:Chaperone SurA [Helicobacter sp. NHP19-003]|uniref:Chaperone SurA n=1 Tax=Helicobacter gastrocanis TaxID=2849641 RepID=A0ABM7SAP0_9HELI|nr:peptidylprolyl isomerase [Helicobacter sp. NHP19-003]BCZ17661.1 Chaperone SurA [Helicobacter sp. NHP19-003]
MVLLHNKCTLGVLKRAFVCLCLVFLSLHADSGSNVESVTGKGVGGAKHNAKSLDEQIKKALKKPGQATQVAPKIEEQKKEEIKEGSSKPQPLKKLPPEDLVEERKDGIVGGIAVTVNNDPITLYQIETLEKEKHISRQQAINSLIIQRIQAQEIKRLKIDIEDDKIDAQIEEIAKHNGMGVNDFMRTLANEGIDPMHYRKQLKKQLETRELLRNILLFNVNTNSETKMREYYNAHREEFSVPSEVLVTRYTAKDTKTLTQALENKDIEIPGVSKGEEKINLKSLNPQIAQMFLSTKEHTFTPILNAGGGNYVSFYIQQKLGKEEVSFSQARSFIANKLIEEQQDKILAEYYEKLRVKAKIKFLR